MLRVGITGGIGSGKTTVCRVFDVLGVPVYDSDSRAKALMTSDSGLISAIKGLFGDDAYTDGRLNTRYIASQVFTDKSLIAKLNGIVHPKVINDFREWAKVHERSGIPYVIYENAILFEGGFDRDMDYSVSVSAPVEERVVRASQRIGITPAQVRERMANQMDDREKESRADYIIYNGESDMILPQIMRLHEIFGSGNLSDGERG